MMLKNHKAALAALYEPRERASEVDVSIIVVNWNTWKLLTECLRSLAQFRGRYVAEVIVLDNGSKDGSQEAIRREFPGVRLIENGANLGFAKANNIGIRAAKGRYLCLVNSDVRVLNDCIDRLVDFMDHHPETGIVGPQILYPDMRIQDSCRKFPSPWNNFCSAFKLNRLLPRNSFFSGEHMFYFPHDMTLKVDSIAGCFMLARKDAVEEVGLLDEQFFMYAEEVDWSKRFSQCGWQIMFYPEAQAVHHHAASTSRDPVRFERERVKSVAKYWRKHHSVVERYEFAAIFCLQHIAGLACAAVIYAAVPTSRGKMKTKISRSFACLHSIIY
jgi:GT2 family glycosyltransferase